MHSPHPELDVRAIALFKMMARFEYALKATGYLERPSGKASPNWDRFARDIEAPLAAAEDADVIGAMEYLISHPPKQQIVQDGQLRWEDSHQDKQPHARLLLTHVRQVRNNLFHGGKFNGHWFDPQRSAELIDASLEVLEHVVDLHPEVQAAFHQ